MGEDKKYHLGIAGNIGAGKTTLATKLGKHYGWHVEYEDVAHNPYLEDFYNDMQRWAFNLQIYFLHSRIKQMFTIQKGNYSVIQDRTIYEDAKIFAPNLYQMGLMNKRDYDNYLALFNTVSEQVAAPNLLIYLKASVPTLVNQIQKRGREYEENLRLDYLKRLNELYENWIAKYDNGPLLVIDVNDINFADNAEDLGGIIEKIDAQLYGLF